MTMFTLTLVAIAGLLVWTLVVDDEREERQSMNLSDQGYPEGLL